MGGDESVGGKSYGVKKNSGCERSIWERAQICSPRNLTQDLRALQGFARIRAPYGESANGYKCRLRWPAFPKMAKFLRWPSFERGHLKADLAILGGRAREVPARGLNAFGPVRLHKLCNPSPDGACRPDRIALSHIRAFTPVLDGLLERGHNNCSRARGLGCF